MATGASGLTESLAVTYADNTDAGIASASASFAGDANHTASSGSTTFTIAKADQTITPSTVSDAGYVIGSTATLDASASSGLPVTYSASGPCSLSDNTLTFTGAGTCALTTSQAGDTNFNAAPDVVQNLNVTFVFNGFLQPISGTAHTINTTTSVFKGGSTVPVKFQLMDANGNVVQASSAPMFWVSASLGFLSSDATPLAYSDTPTSGNLFKFDSASGRYIYNWSTKNVASGNWYEIMAFADGQVFWTIIGLK